MGRWISLFGMLLYVLLALPVYAHAEGWLQEQIDAIPSGGTIVLKEGVYRESLILTKPITVEGSSDTIISLCTEAPVITIKGENVTVKNLQVESCSNAEGATAFSLKGENHHLENIKITTLKYGIKLEGTKNSTISHVEIIGKGNENGIDLWKSSDNLINRSTIQHVQDGVYLENSHGNKIVENSVKQSRYGFHLMFSDQTELIGNQSSENSTGTMIMGTKDTKVENNDFLENNENVHSQGILIYDTTNATIVNNNLNSNRVGIYIDAANQNTIDNNLLSQNFIGIQFYNSHRNTFGNNTFIGNVNDSQAIDSSDNDIHENYWDLSLKLDKLGNGISMIPYTSDPYFLSLTSYTPEFQLFFHSPGMIVLQKLLKSEEETLLRDDSPRMEPTESLETYNSPHTKQWMLSFTMIIVSFIIFIMGRRKL